MIVFRKTVVCIGIFFIATSLNHCGKENGNGSKEDGKGGEVIVEPPEVDKNWTKVLPFPGPINVCGKAASDDECRKKCNDTNIPITEKCIVAGPQFFWESKEFEIDKKTDSKAISKLIVRIKADNHSLSCSNAFAQASIVDENGDEVENESVIISECLKNKLYEIIIFGLDFETLYKLRLGSEQAGDGILIVREVEMEAVME